MEAPRSNNKLRGVVLLYYHVKTGVSGNSGKNVEETEGNGNRGFLM